LEYALGPLAVDQLSEVLDLPYLFGGAGLHSLERSADEELIGSFATITASVVAFYTKDQTPSIFKSY